MSMFPFSYSAVVYNGIDPATNVSKYACESGMSFCDSFAEAASIIAERYGDNLKTFYVGNTDDLHAHRPFPFLIVNCTI